MQSGWHSGGPVAFPEKASQRPFNEAFVDALAPDGHVVVVDDGVRDAQGVSRFVSDPTGAGAERRFPGGREFTIVKVAYDPEELEALLTGLGWIAKVTPYLSGLLRP
jgi:hypothetical protein